MTTGFVGLGQIGRPMAERLTAPLVYDVRAEAAHGFDHVASSPEEVAANCDVISVMVRDDAQVREVVERLVPAARTGTVIAVHSTIAPSTAEGLASAAEGTEVAVVDAPVSGGAIGAHEGTLAVMIGGPAAAVERCREPFSAWASLLVHTGEAGSATRMKIARNLVTFASFAAAGEAQRLAEAAGLDLRTLAEVVRHSDRVTSGPGAIMFRDSAAPLAPEDPWRDVLEHTVGLGHKDLSLALELAGELGVRSPMASVARDELATALGVV